MAITRLYSESHPDGAVVNAADLDTVIKEFKVDVRDRAVGLGALDFASVLVGAELAFDYLRVKSAAGGIKNADLTADILAWSAQRYVTAPAQPRCHLFNNLGTAFVAGVNTVIPFASEQVDTASMHDNATNNSRITIPTGGSGNYLVQATMVAEARSIGLLLNTVLGMYKNGISLSVSSSYLPSSFIGTSSINPQAMYTHNLSYVIPLVAGDYLELFYYSNSNQAGSAGINFSAMLLS